VVTACIDAPENQYITAPPVINPRITGASVREILNNPRFSKIRIIEKITGKESFYKSPTDMGVNRAGFGIVDDELVQEAAHQEIIRRYFRCACEYGMGFVEREILDRSELIMKNVGATVEDRVVVLPARQAGLANGYVEDFILWGRTT